MLDHQRHLLTESSQNLVKLASLIRTGGAGISQLPQGGVIGGNATQGRGDQLCQCGGSGWSMGVRDIAICTGKGVGKELANSSTTDGQEDGVRSGETTAFPRMAKAGQVAVKTANCGTSKT